MKKLKFDLALAVILTLIISILGLDLVNTANSKVESNIERTSHNQLNIISEVDNSEVMGIYNSVPIPTEIVQVTPIISPTLEPILPTSTSSPKPTTKPTLKPTAKAQVNSSEISKSAVYKSINSYRATKGLAEVQVDSRLETSALNKAKDMVANNYFDHGNPWSFITSSGYKFDYASENLAVNYFNSASLVDGWKNSPTHNLAMLDDRNQHMGFAYLCDIAITQYENTCLAVIHFAREPK
jgi:uncharacterized protein YkwD